MIVFSRLRRWSALAAAACLTVCALPAFANEAPPSAPGVAAPAAAEASREAEVLVTLAALHEDSLNQSMTWLPLVRERAKRRPLELSIQQHAAELRTLREWLSELPDRPPTDYLPKLPEPGGVSRLEAERQYLQAMLAHHDALAQLARRAEGLALRPELKTLLAHAHARAQAEHAALQTRLEAL